MAERSIVCLPYAFCYRVFGVHNLTHVFRADLHACLVYTASLPCLMQTYTQGEYGLTVIKELDVAVLATPVSQASKLKDETFVNSLLISIGAPTAVIEAIVSRLPTAEPVFTSSGMFQTGATFDTGRRRLSFISTQTPEKSFRFHSE